MIMKGAIVFAWLHPCMQGYGSMESIHFELASSPRSAQQIQQIEQFLLPLWREGIWSARTWWTLC